MASIAYKRVSSVDQNVARQLDGESFDREFVDKASARDTERPQLQEMLDYAREGDLITVHSIDRLARNLADLLSLIQQINVLGVSITFRKESLTFTGEDSPMQTMMLQLMGAVAEFERSMIRERQREGIAAARAAGKYLGPEIKFDDEARQEIKRLADSGMRPGLIQEQFSLSRTSYYRIIKEMSQKAVPSNT